MRKEVCHIISGLRKNGAEGVLVRLIESDKENVHTVISLSGDENGYEDKLKSLGVAVFHCVSPFGKFTPIIVIRLLVLLWRIKPDVVQTWMYRADVLGGICARLIGYRNVCWNVRHSDFTEYYESFVFRLTFSMISWLARLIPRTIIFCSDESKDWHLEVGFPICKAVVIENGYDFSSLKPTDPRMISDSERFEFCCVARLSGQKGHMVLFEACKILLQRQHNFVLTLLGYGTDQDDIKRLAQSFELENCIRFLGHRENIGLFFAEADFSVLASTAGEGFPNVLVESMACGRPVIATDVGASRSIVGQCGIVVRPGCAISLADAIETYFGEMVSESSRWAKRCSSSVQVVTEKYSARRMTFNYRSVWFGKQFS